MHNVELKAELRDIELARAICKQLGATHGGDIAQTDTYYKVLSGRLKRRDITYADNGSTEVEYIYYDRADRASARLSHYVIYDENTAKERFGAGDLPETVRVSKRRELYLTGPVRIHLDQVEDLGTFVEFEAVVSRAHPVKRCHELVAELKEHFRPVTGEPIAVSYCDMAAIEHETKNTALSDPFGFEGT